MSISINSSPHSIGEDFAQTSPSVIVSFPIQGKQLPADHGYALYASVTKQLPRVHNVKWLGIELISGVPWNQGLIALPSRGGSLRLRIPADKFGEVLALAGKRLNISGEIIRLGIPNARPLVPAASLYSRIVTIKNFTEPEPFLEAARRQVEALGLSASLELPLDGEGRYRRRIVTIQGKHVVGFSVAAHKLSDDDSIRLQSVGIGGRRSMGCGHFNAIRSGAGSKQETDEPTLS